MFECERVRVIVVVVVVVVMWCGVAVRCGAVLCCVVLCCVVCCVLCVVFCVLCFVFCVLCIVLCVCVCDCMRALSCAANMQFCLEDFNVYCKFDSFRHCCTI